MTGKTLTACPGKCPEWRGKAYPFQFLFRFQPQCMGFVCQTQSDFRDMWRCQDRGILQNEALRRFTIEGHGDSAHIQSGFSVLPSSPPMRQTSIHSSSVTG